MDKIDSQRVGGDGAVEKSAISLKVKQTRWTFIAKERKREEEREEGGKVCIWKAARQDDML